ncbi:MAG: beta-ketoacyl synthase N-terminal-like domain-containing protein [Bacteroidetes bacterium]|nr:beta-ketoacyl synthase N-terminal-like domain-containing protein [Bacteroidota bacterium]
MMKPLYIQGIGNVSPQKSYDNSHFLDEVAEVETNMLKSLDPNYKEYIAGDMVRRMSRIIKMGVAAGKICLADAAQGPEPLIPDAIITGTGLGCIEDTEKFLSNMIRNNEEFLTPTAFIQSTHNTVSAQIALLLKCHNYNFTYVHRGFSFESALLDSFVRIGSGEAATVLLGGMDEMTANTFTILQRLGQYKQKPVNNLNIFREPSRGAIAGEGAAFFFVANKPGGKNYARIEDLDTIYRPDKGSIPSRMLQFLERNGKNQNDIDLVIPGVNGDPANDKVYDEVMHNLFQDKAQAAYKHLCGEYETASAFGLWLAAMILKTGQVPAPARLPGIIPGTVRNILLYNHYHDLDHSLMLVSSI